MEYIEAGCSLHLVWHEVHCVTEAKCGRKVWQTKLQFCGLQRKGTQRLSHHAVKPRESHAILRSEPYVTPRFCAFTWQCNGGCARSDCSSLNSYFKSFSIPILGRIQSDESSWEQKGPKSHARSEPYWTLSLRDLSLWLLHRTPNLTMRAQTTHHCFFENPSDVFVYLVLINISTPTKALPLDLP